MRLSLLVLAILLSLSLALAACESATESDRLPGSPAAATTEPTREAPSATATEAPAADEPDATPSPEPTATVAPSFVAEVGRRTSELRGIPLPDDVDVSFIARDEVLEVMTSLYSDEDRERLEDLQILYRLLGFIGMDDRLMDVYLDFAATGVAGFYAPRSDELFVVGDGSEPSFAEEVVLAHEWTHALQDARFDLDAMFDASPPPDAELALTALVEGDAVLTQEAYEARYRAALVPGDGVVPAALQAPDSILRETFFPYTAGPRFLRQVMDGARLSIDDVYADPPGTTAEILHPELYLEGWAPPPVIHPPIQVAGWEVRMQTTLGEFQLRNHLRNHLSAEDAEAAAEGWNGDSLTVLDGDADEGTVALLVHWADAAEAAEFESAYREVLAGSAQPVFDNSVPFFETFESEDGVRIKVLFSFTSTAIVWSTDADAANEAAEQMPRGAIG